MKKEILNFVLVAALLVSAQNMAAQNWLNAPKSHFGIRAGIAATNTLADDWDGDYGSTDLISPMAGIAYDTRIAKIPFYVETGLYFLDRGQKYKIDRNGYHHSYATTERESNFSMLVPAVISYHAYTGKNISIQPFMGPYLAYGFSDEEIDYGWRLGCGLNIKQFYVNMGYDIGLKDDFDTHEGHVSTAFITVGWNFLGKR